MMGTGDFGFTRDTQDTLAIQDHFNPLPRSVTRGDIFLLLDGDWQFAFDPEDRGLREQWYLGHRFAHTASWPGSIETHLIALEDAQQHRRPWQDRVVAWYEREFLLPDDWQAAPDCLLQLTFGACSYETRVWLNGHPLQTVEGEDVHFGAYTSFSYELPDEYLLPRNRLTVQIAHSLDAEIPRGKQESRVYKRGGIWYQTISGPVRSVWLEPVKRNRLRSRLGVISTIEDRLVEFILTARIHDPGIYTLRLLVAPLRSKQPMAISEVKLPLEAGQKRQRVVMDLAGSSLWSPEVPTLYQLVAQLIGLGGSLSQIETHFGLRKVEARGRGFYLNNQQLYLDGILYQPGTASFAQMRRHLLAMKQLGCNLVRVHIAGIDPRIYDLADEIGMLLWVEVPSPHSSSERSRSNHWAELMRMLAIIGSHPSIVIWSLYNEDWGAEDIATNAETQTYMASVYAFMRLHYPQLLVVDNDGWNHLSTEGRLEAHLLTAHLYTPDMTQWQNLLDQLVEGQIEGLVEKPLVVGDPFFYRGQIPLVVSEWGGFGYVEYAGPTDPQAKAERIRAFKRELRRRPIAGDVYTQAVSIEEEVNGLIDPDSGELLVPPGLLDSRKLA
jgi:hypothetical protein